MNIDDTLLHHWINASSISTATKIYISPTLYTVLYNDKKHSAFTF